MITIPFQIKPGEFTLFIGLEDENIARVKEYDPAIVTEAQLPVRWKSLKLTEVVISYLTEADKEWLTRAANDGTPITEILRHVTRGFAFRPDKGDYDGPAMSITPEEGKPQ